MKNRIIIFIAAIALISVVGCKKFTETQLLGQETQENFFNVGDNAVYAVNSCYDFLKASEGYNGSGHFYEFMVANNLSDDSRKGSTAGDYPELNDLKTWMGNSGSGAPNSLWKICFGAIYRCNTVLANIGNAKIDNALKNRLIGEVKFLRGYYYFMLVRSFGPVPLFTAPVKPSEFHTVRASMDKVYKQIDLDFTEAAAILPSRSGYSSLELGRATSGAAKAYLARSIMYQLGTNYENYLDKNAGWQKVYDLCNNIQQSGEYTLMKNYATIFEKEGENCSESIFEVQCAENPNPPYGQGKWGNELAVFTNPRGDWGGWGFDTPLDALVSAYEANDPRMRCTVVSDGDICYGVKITVTKDASDGTGHHNRKNLWQPKVTQPTNSKESAVNMRQFRFADIILMKAEAAYYLGKEQEARDLVNTIRERARNSTMTKGSKAGQPNVYAAPDVAPVLAPITSSGAQLLTDILKERRTELGMENLRYMDLVRNQKYLTSIPAADATNCLLHCIDYKGNKIPVLPINKDEALNWLLDDATTGINAQNPGY